MLRLSLAVSVCSLTACPKKNIIQADNNQGDREP